MTIPKSPKVGKIMAQYLKAATILILHTFGVQVQKKLVKEMPSEREAMHPHT